MGIGFEEINRRMGYHPATADTIPQFERNRHEAISLADMWDQWLPDGREKSLALTALQEALMWANAAVACQTQAEPFNPLLCNVPTGAPTGHRCQHIAGHGGLHRDGSVSWS